MEAQRGEQEGISYLLRELGDEKRRNQLLLNEINRLRRQLELCRRRLLAKANR